MHCATIILLYAPERVAATARIAKALHQALGGRMVVVVNGDRINVTKAEAFLPHAEWVRHDNTGMEFGGYQAGLDLLGADLPDRVVIVNDTISHHDSPTRTLLRCFVRDLSMDLRKFAVGRIYSQPRIMRLQGMHSPRWIRTHMFALDREAVRALGNRIHCPEVGALISASPDPDVFFGEVAGALRDLLAHFLFVPGQYNWYAAAPLTAGNCAAMARKASAILQEKYLTMRLEAADTGLWDIHLSRTERAISSAEGYWLKIRGQDRRP